MSGRSRFIIVLSMASLLAFGAIGPASAGKGGGTTAKLTFTSSPGATATQVTVGSQYYVVGSGFKANAWVTIGAHYSTTMWGSGWTNSNGKITIGPYTASSCGQIYHEGDQMNQHNGRFSLKAGATLDVPCP